MSSDAKIKKSASMTSRRVIAYIVLVLISILCLFWFYVLFVNATRTHSAIQTGFSAIPGKNLVNNFNHLMESIIPVFRGMLNSVIVAGSSALLSTYFSTCE